MQKFKFILAIALTGASLTSWAQNKNASSAIAGVNLANRDVAIRAQDDFYQYVNGAWLTKTAIPADKASWGAFNELNQATINQLRSIVQDLPLNKNNTANAKKLLTLYQNFMAELNLDSLGVKPLNDLFTQIDNLTSTKQIPALMAELSMIGVNMPYSLVIHQDAKDSTKAIADLYQSGLGLPDRDYYLSTTDANLVKMRQAYQQYMGKMLALAGVANPNKMAQDVLDLETKLAKVQWTKVANRDPVKTYNSYPLTKLNQLAANYPWPDYLKAAELSGKINLIVVSQPSYITGFNQILQTTPLAVWQEYFKWQVLNSFAPYLNQKIVAEHFAFYGKTLSGVKENKPRWQRGISLLDGAMGEALGQLYVAKYFPEQNKQQVKHLVNNLLLAYQQSIESLTWMGKATKQKAQEKLASIMLKIAYPDKWRDYTKLTIVPNDLVANLIAVSQFEYQRNINKLNRPVDRSEWGMTPQTVNAYYNPEFNEIVFPAAILQAPFFNAKADAAVNYGGIGAVIGHEISHGFDDQGSQYDAKGNLVDWFSKEDHRLFKEKTAALVKQYSAYTPMANYHVNGELTLGENIADNSGLAIAYKAYLLSLAGESAPVLAGLTGTQRFYFAWAEVWRNKMREAQQIVSLQVDPHSPSKIRANATLRNQDGFYQAFKVESGDKMYLAPVQRVKIW